LYIDKKKKMTETYQGSFYTYTQALIDSYPKIREGVFMPVIEPFGLSPKAG
jgi:hypothetical protein